MEDIKVSVICVTYNHELYIRDTIEGFLKQKTNFKYEVLIHDDASTDGTADIIREYEAKYPEIIKPIYQTENQYSKGVQIINQIIAPHVKGRYVAFCEGDDFWTDENKLQIQVDFLDNEPEYVACAHAYKKIDMRDNSVKEIHSFPESSTITTNQVIEGDGNLFATCSVMYKSENFLFIAPFRENASVGDYPLIIQMALSGKVYYIDKVMSCYRYMLPDSWSARNMINAEDRKKHIEKAQEFLEKADVYSEYKYHKSFQYIIDKKWFLYYYKSESLLFLKKNFREYYSRFTLKYKVYIHLKKYAPFIINLIKVRKKLYHGSK